jgi:hypothetical protein
VSSTTSPWSGRTMHEIHQHMGIIDDEFNKFIYHFIEAYKENYSGDPAKKEAVIVALGAKFAQYRADVVKTSEV